MPIDNAADLQAVRGIGPKAAARLKSAGITDLATLAQTPPNELAAALAGLRGKFDADRIDREKWITQAAALVAAAPCSAADPPEQDAAQLVRHGFTVEVRVHQEGHDVVSTTITHAATGDEDAWGGWDPGRLIAFVRERSGLPTPGPEPGQGSSQQADSVAASAPAAPPPEPRPDPGIAREQSPGHAPSPARVYAYAMVPATGPGSAGGHSPAVTATLTLGRGQLGSVDPGPVSLRAEVLARQLLAGGSVVVGRGSVVVESADPIRLEVPCDLSSAQAPLVLCATVRILVPDDGERAPARELTGARLLISS